MPEGRRSLGSRLKHAFAVDPPGPAVPSEEERRVVDKVCREIVRRRLVTPTLLGLEMSRPLNFIGAQTMHFFQPFIAAIVPTGGYRHFASFLEQRGSIETICRRLEELEAERVHAERGQDETRPAPEPPGEGEHSQASDGNEQA